MTEIYYGRSLSIAFQAVAHDLGGMRAAVHLAVGPRDIAVRKRYTRDLTLREQDLVNLADHPTPKNWQTTILRRTNELLYEIHLLVQLPLWQYVIKTYNSVDVVTAVRTTERQ